jgi:hypothetical protein
MAVHRWEEILWTPIGNGWTRASDGVPFERRSSSQICWKMVAYEQK